MPAKPILVAILGIASALVLGGTARLALVTRRRPVSSGAAAMVGAIADVEGVDGSDQRTGWARIEGELWKVVSEAPLRRRQHVKVTARVGLVLQVVPIDQDVSA